METLRRLQDWYLAQCDGDWEHQSGVKIDTLDNPGWRISIDLEGTPLENAEFKELSNLAPESKWIQCKVENRRFEGHCGPELLEDMLMIFLQWVDTVPKKDR